MKINVYKIKYKYNMKTCLWKHELLDYDYDYDAAMLLKKKHLKSLSWSWRVTLYQ